MFTVFSPFLVLRCWSYFFFLSVRNRTTKMPIITSISTVIGSCKSIPSITLPCRSFPLYPFPLCLSFCGLFPGLVYNLPDNPDHSERRKDRSAYHPDSKASEQNTLKPIPRSHVFSPSFFLQPGNIPLLFLRFHGPHCQRRRPRYKPQIATLHFLHPRPRCY